MSGNAAVGRGAGEKGSIFDPAQPPSVPMIAKRAAERERGIEDSLNGRRADTGAKVNVNG
jgi:hypothetical protein